MSKIGDLKANENNKVNLVKILELFCNGDTKYVEMLLKIFKSNGDSSAIKLNAIEKRTGIDSEKLVGLTENEIEMMYYFIDNNMLMSNIKEFQKFISYNERNLIDNKDLQGYKSFSQLSSSVKMADEKLALKELEKQIKKIYEDDDWLILIPLTYESSKKYGYNTKWCTASDSTSEQYKSYTRDGLLIYIIEKGKAKTAVYKKRSNGEVSFWNQTDARIDSIQTNFPENIMGVVKMALINNVNTKYGVEETQNIDDYFSKILAEQSKKSIKDALKVPTEDWMEYKSYGLDASSFNTLSNHLIDTSSPRLRNTDAIDAVGIANEKLFNLNSPDYINKVRNLMKKLT